MASTQDDDQDIEAKANFDNAMSYLNVVKAELQDRPGVYAQFIQLMTAFHQHK